MGTMGCNEQLPTAKTGVEGLRSHSTSIEPADIAKVDFRRAEVDRVAQLPAIGQAKPEQAHARFKGKPRPKAIGHRR